MNIAIQGIIGSYHHQVALDLYCEKSEIIECVYFSEIPQFLKDRRADIGIMAIENSIAGAILPNYNLIDEYNLFIHGEYYLKIEHQLMTLPNQVIKDIHEVWSHPMALEQCRHFFYSYPQIKLIEEKDTAEVAKIIQEKQLKGIAAIASRKAAEIYNLEIIADNIQNNNQNYTRFVLLSSEKSLEDDKFNKASVKFILSHKVGSLSEILIIFKKYNINLCKIQSLPIIEKPWEYSFFADMIFDNINQFMIAIEEIKSKVEELKILGKYIHKSL
jgi:prephenate dehydratase